MSAVINVNKPAPNVNKPAPLDAGKQVRQFNSRAEVALAIQALETGQSVIISDFYSSGLSLLKDLHEYLGGKIPNESFIEQREYRAAYRKLSNLILLEIKDQKLCVKKAPSIGWLEKFYPENNHFMLTLPQVQGLNSAWQWHLNGISIPVLRNKLHPFYGVYFPTRFDHLILFDNWLKRYEGPKKTAIDIGVGSGVLSLQLVKHGFQKVFATDTNPNAIIGLSEYIAGTKLSRKIELDFADLFGKWEKETELIVFNPPWLPVAHELERIDEAIYYNEKLFPEFFAGAADRLLPEGKLLVLFSNLAQITEVSQVHPIEKELAEGGRFELERCFKKKVKAASENTKRDQHWRASEEVELWVLTKK